MSHRRKNIKIVLIGDTGVGKTSLSSYYVLKKATMNFGNTIGAAFMAKNIKINDQEINIHIWDTAGQERFKSMGRIYYNGSYGCICVFDLTKRETFNNVKSWIEEYKNANNTEHSIIIVGNKADIQKDLWEVSHEEINKLAEELGYKYLLTNCITGENINEVFEELVKNIIENNSKFNMPINHGTARKNEEIIDLTKKLNPFSKNNNCKC